jgi:hypothetical protein
MSPASTEWDGRDVHLSQVTIEAKVTSRLGPAASIPVLIGIRFLDPA